MNNAKNSTVKHRQRISLSSDFLMCPQRPLTRFLSKEKITTCCATNGVTLCHMPSSNLKIGSGLADVKSWHDHDIRVTIGTDGAGSNNNLDMIEEVTLASYLAKGIHRDPLLFSTGDLLTFATRNGALAQGREDTGLLEPGFRADLAVVDMNAFHFQPMYDYGTSLFTNANASDVALTMVDGRILYRDGKLMTIDIEKVIWNVNRVRDEKTCPTERITSRFDHSLINFPEKVIRAPWEPLSRRRMKRCCRSFLLQPNYNA